MKAVFFDLDGTILDSEKIYLHFWMETARQLGFSLSREEALKVRSCDPSISRAIVENATGAEGSYDQIRALRKKLMSAYLAENDIDLKPGVTAFLSRISTLPLQKAIVTTSNPQEKLPMLQKYGIADYFDRIVSVKDVKRGKPYPEIYTFACRQLGLAPQECVAIEDSPNGIKSAYDAGVHVIMVPDLSEPDETLLQMCKAVSRIDLIPDSYLT